LIIPFQLSKRLRQSKPRLHRYLGRSFVLLGLVMGLAGLYIGLVYPFAGIKESIFVVPFSVLFLFSLYKGFVYARQKRFDLHKKWMFVSVAVGFTPVTMRFIFSPYIFFTGISGREVFVETMVIGLLVNLVVLRLYWSKQQNRSRLGKLSSNILSDKQA
ncbi:MAG: DUF2306 domain-containing protein, partial [Gammaproteobacteria bacterium]|nr:DUF2306 domain-containing protein [Gammaproteobacteria bacterium]